MRTAWREAVAEGDLREAPRYARLREAGDRLWRRPAGSGRLPHGSAVLAAAGPSARPALPAGRSR